jgi:uncharacterized protein
MHRRSFLSRLALLSMGAACARPSTTLANGASSRRRLLCYSRSQGFEHSVVKSGPGGAPSLVDRSITALAQRDGFDVECTKDGSVFTPEGLRAYDAFFFYTTGNLEAPGGDGTPPMPRGGKAALLDAIRGGKGFVGVHSETDTFHSQPYPPAAGQRWLPSGAATDPFIAMIGGEFISHGRQQQGRLRVTDARFPGMDGFADGTSRMAWASGTR